MKAFRNPLPDAADWAERLDLVKLSARHWAGPCPLCGGHDRFHVTQGVQRTLVGCRGCMDTEVPETRRKRFGRLLREVFPDMATRNRSRQYQGVHGRKSCTYTTHPGTKKDPPQTDPDLIRTLWSLSLPLAGTPGETYLVKRRLWPPGNQAPFPLPDCIAWLPQEQAIPPEPGWPGIPKELPGAIIIRYDLGADIGSVHLIGIKQNGTPLQPPNRPAWRRNTGSPRGTHCLLPAFARTPEKRTGLVISEGITTALACAWLHPGSDSMSIGSLNNAGSIDLSPVTPYQRILINTDGDEHYQGHRLGTALYKRLHLLSHNPVIYYRTHGDAADELASTIDLYGLPLWKTVIDIHRSL